MPHVIVKLWPGESEQKKVKLTELISEGVQSILGYGEESVSVAFEEIPEADWAQRVYRSEIIENATKLYKKPGYTM